MLSFDGNATPTMMDQQQAPPNVPANLINDSDDPTPYTCVGKLGAGTFGHVFLYQRVLLDGTLDQVAVKQFRLVAGSEESTLLQVSKESAIMSQFDHENVVKFYDAYLDNECVTIAMEYCPNGSLRQLLGQPQPLRSDLLLTWLHEIAQAAEYFHLGGVAHRDLKPENILFDEAMRVKVADFGTVMRAAARSAVDTTTATCMNNKAAGSPTAEDGDELCSGITGTFGFMAPEVVLGKKYGHACDVWSIGCIAAQMLRIRLAPFALELRGLEEYYTTTFTSGVIPMSLPLTASGEPAVLPPLVKAFLEQCLDFDPARRLSASDIVDHEVFTQEVVEELSLYLQSIAMRSPVGGDGESGGGRLNNNNMLSVGDKSADLLHTIEDVLD